ncbi:unnamed protein product [Spirodela intermedia]|uniref:Uncharacterized protein n=1 Tax=Spirodela intermedia TaxID=51605 RepID=A0A7I8KJG3_SPIIN|nr:unnamed protein product [Spirodela intermedia]
MSLEQVLDRSILRDKAGEYVGADLDSTDCKQNGYKLDPVPLCLPENEVVRRETEFYMNKVVRDVEQPKMILCYKEGSYDIVKDICVDEGLHSLDGALSENEVKKYVKSSNDFELNSLKLASLSEQLHLDLSGEDTDHTSSGDLPEEGEDMSGTVDSSDGQQSTQDEHHVSDPGGEDPKHSSVEIASVEPHEKNIGGMLSPPVEPVSRQSPRRSGRRYSLAELLAEDKKDNGTSTPMSQGASEKPEPSTSITTSEDIKDENEADSGVKTEAFDAAVPEKESLGGSSEIQPSGFPSSETQNKNVNAPMVASRPSFYRGNGDSNLLGPSFLSGRMYSGHLQYSGSVSLRSDSSTTSTRSFAFPVLQSEWNSSPIKMVEGGRFRRRRGWGSGFFCCRS